MPVAKKENAVISIGSFDIIVGNTYEVIGKKDYSAPDGFQMHETTKFLIPGIKEIRSVPYDENSRRWDTGFEEHSPCNAKIPRDQRKVLVDTYIKNIKKPYEAWCNKSTEATEDDFWGGNDKIKAKPYFYEVYTGKTFDTKKPSDLFDLFIALKQGVICKKGEKDPSLKSSAKYCIRDREQAVSLKEEKASNKAEAIFTFMTLLNALDPKKVDDDTLYTVLEWLQFTSVRNTDKEALKSLVLKRFEDPKTGYETCDRFLEAYNLTKNDGMREEMEMFSIVTRLNHKGVFEYKRSQYFLDGDSIGSNLKGIAKKALDNPTVKARLIDEYEKHS